MLKIEIHESTPANMLRAIRAACNELLGETRQAGEQEWPHAVSSDEKAAQHVTEANRLNAAANSELDQAAASLSAHNAEQTILANAFDKAVEIVGAPAVAQALQNEQTSADEILTGFDVDSTGAEWNAELHASTKSKNADGTWKKRRGASQPATTQEATEQIAAAFAESPLAAPPVPPTPPAAPAEPIMPKIFALITSQIVTINQAVEAAQAEGYADLGANGLGGAPREAQEAVLRKLEAA